MIRRPRSRGSRRLSFFGGLALALGLTIQAAAAQAGPARWIGSWSSAPTEPVFPVSRTSYQSNPGINAQTVRETVTLSIGGSQIRVRMSNAHGRAPLAIGGASVGRPAGGARVAAGSIRRLTFAGSASVTIPPGGFVLSDPVPLEVRNFDALAISIHVPAITGPLTWHYFSSSPTPTYYSPPGDFVLAQDMPVESSSTPGSYGLIMAGVDVLSSTAAGAIVAIGDSITDAGRSEGGVVGSWPAFLAHRLLEREGPRFGVLNQAIAGNALLGDLVGANGLARFDRDVIAQPGVRYVVTALGINDLIEPNWLNLPQLEASADELIFGMQQLVARAHAVGLKIYGCTITPGITGLRQREAWTLATEAKRQKVNAWIRESGAFDAVIDFDLAVRDPQRPDRILPAFLDPGLSVHTNPAGAKAMADAIDLSLFR